MAAIGARERRKLSVGGEGRGRRRGEEEVVAAQALRDGRSVVDLGVLRSVSRRTLTRRRRTPGSGGPGGRTTRWSFPFVRRRGRRGVARWPTGAGRGRRLRAVDPESGRGEVREGGEALVGRCACSAREREDHLEEPDEGPDEEHVGDKSEPRKRGLGPFGPEGTARPPAASSPSPPSSPRSTQTSPTAQLLARAPPPHDSQRRPCTPAARLALSPLSSPARPLHPLVGLNPLPPLVTSSQRAGSRCTSRPRPLQHRRPPCLPTPASPR